jgi:hypothetical protein
MTQAANLGALGTNVDSSGDVSLTTGVTGTLPSSALPSGTIKQVLSIAMTATASYSTSNTQVATPLTLTITPSSTSSRIFITGRIAASGSGGFTGGGFTLFRNSTNLNNASNGTSGSNSGQMMAFWNPADVQSSGLASNDNAMTQIPISFIDSPATTSATTYTVYATGVGGAANVLVNTAKSDSMRSSSQLIVMEIA